jgi:hypothetical protein
MLLKNFLGGSYLDESVAFSADRAINWIPEVSGSPGSKNVGKFSPRAGLQLFATLPHSGDVVRGLWAGENRLFAAGKTTVYEIMADGSTTANGRIGFSNNLVSEGDPVIMLPNGAQLGIIAGGYFYLDDGTGVYLPQWNDGTINPPAADPLQSSNIPACYGTFIDGYYIVVLSAFLNGTKVFQLSDLAPVSSLLPSGLGGLGGANWTPQLDAATKEGYPDNIAAIFADHENLFIFGDEESTEVWQDTGSANFPFQRVPGNFIHYGCGAAFSVCRFMNGVAWLAGDQQRGGPIAVYALGGQPQRVSTHAIEQQWQTYSTWGDAVSWSMVDRGHNLWVISFPSGNATWVYDGNTQLWHEWGFWNGSSFDQFIGRYHAFVNLQGYSAGLPSLSGQHFVGDYRNGNIYTMSSQYFDDAGARIHRVRTCPHISDEEKQIYYAQMQLDMEGIGADPVLDWSYDHGHTFTPVPARAASMGVLVPGSPPSAGLYSNVITANAGPGSRAMWRRLGKSRDRVFRFTTTAPVFHALINAYLMPAEGTS